MSTLAPVLATEAPLDAEIVGEGLPGHVIQAEFADKGGEPISGPSLAARLGGFVWRTVRLILSATDWLFGVAALIVGLSFLATYPLLQMLSLGYLLEVSGRIYRTGRLRDGFVGVRKASRVGSIVFGTWAVLLPLRYVSSVAASARLIDPDSRAARGWAIGLVVLTVLAVAHIVSACWRGGRLRNFLWPRPIRLVKSIFRGGAYTEARDAAWDFIVGLRLPYYFWLGLRGFAGGLIWLFIPISLIAAGQKVPPLGFLGALILMLVVLYLPFLQARFAAENRFRAHFELREVRKLFRKAPVMFLLSLLFTLLFAIPLYLLKIEIVPREAAWLPSLVFVVFIFPARLLTGWSCGRAARRPKNRNFFLRQAARLAILPIVAFYVLIVFLTQFTSWHGVASLYEQHAFLVPVPFLGL
ncbi:MAG TPA: hypothetical protein VG125_27905 [Pirellulales bacterium]|jgi:hypothetical protein|nr:hypothetical protein [Pirellulales bacterium]